ncbi:hypothetical protein YC2023_093639 [Brassica napus]
MVNLWCHVLKIGRDEEDELANYTIFIKEYNQMDLGLNLPSKKTNLRMEGLRKEEMVETMRDDESRSEVGERI